ncbi:NCS2 family permease [Sediminitomix flava]|uniref:AGZA family xanthine/uracil permease-like MFS transporter n=1 Tax=Sediminitomix flava TaxID=379075 RepID=A0A316A2H7_SEDFL|nr:NCS2 family permease [Sediminitomix flava]PWJ43907.1 AGZA family xanthine/uracil permease-like MFS transporter [Sediminitomix flava]
MIERIFKLSQRNTTVTKEFVGGLTTFLTMAYIIFVNPSILGDAGMDKGALITVTCLSAFIGTILVALRANLPFAMAPGMGLNAFFTYSLVFGKGVSWEVALGVVFLSGIVFVLFTFIGLREKIVKAIPITLRLSMAAGIGLFISFIGFKNLGMIVDNPATLVSLGEFTTPVILGLVGLTVTAILEIKGIKGGILLGILITTVLGMVLGEVALPDSIISTPPSIEPIAFKLDIMGALKWSLIGPIFSFMFVDLFDSVGTIIACSYEAKMVKKDGSIEKVGEVLEADSLATLLSAVLGTSTTTTYIESASGISAGARTGLASIFTAAFFLLAMLFTPIIGIVPAFATAPALIIVGVYMFKNVSKINLGDITEAIPAFLTIFLMPLTYSISNGLSFGFISFVLVKVVAGKGKEVSPILWGVAVLSALNLIVG